MVNMITKKEGEPGGEPRRGRGRPRGATAQGAETRRLLYETAIAMFGERGFEATTLRDVAARADVSPALLYRYFPSKHAIVLALYDDLSRAFSERAARMPAGRWRDRFAFTLRTSLEALAPHRGAMVALVPLMVGGRDDGLFSPATAFSRVRVQRRFAESVKGAKDAPRGDDGDALARVLYLAHLGVILWWLLDRSEGQSATRRLVALLQGLAGPFSLALRLPPMRRAVREFDELTRRALFDDRAAVAEGLS